MPLHDGQDERGWDSVPLLLVDALPRPAGFSFADVLAANLGFAPDEERRT